VIWRTHLDFKGSTENYPYLKRGGATPKRQLRLWLRVELEASGDKREGSGGTSKKSRRFQRLGRLGWQKEKNTDKGGERAYNFLVEAVTPCPA